jgi:heptosyltransferase-2
LALQKILLIQTAFIGDVILATGLIEKLREYFPEAQIDFLLRKGNESVLTNHPYLHKVLIWDKKKQKYNGLLRLIQDIRREKYNLVVNLQRFASMGLLTALSAAEQTIGFNKNPFSTFFSKAVPHIIGDSKHEIERNHT